MKLTFPNRQTGSVLMLTIVVVGIISLALGSYLSLVATQNRTVVSAYTWNTALPYAEAGIEEGLTHLTVSGGSNLAANGWTASGGNWVRTNTIADGFYKVTISQGPSNFVVLAEGTAPRISSPGTISRSVRVTTQRQSRVPGIVALTGIRVGGTAYFDSYDSSDPLHSSSGMYSPALADDDALLATNGQTNSISIGGSVVIKGDLATGPGGTITAIGGASVGDSTYSSAGIQSGHSTDDFNYHAPDVLAPYSFGLGLPSPVSVAGINYTVLSIADAKYFHGGNFSGKLLITQPTTLYVAGNVDTSLIKILPGASLKLYVGGTSFTTSSSGSGESGIINQSKPENFELYGLPSLSQIKLSGGSSFSGSIYAPSATFNPTGNIDFFGAIVVSYIDAVNNLNFHFDEALLKSEWDDFIVATWDEI